MILRNLPQMFTFRFPQTFFYKEVCDRWEPFVRRMKLPFSTVCDFMNSQVQSVDFPDISLSGETQQQGQYETAYPAGRELGPELTKALSVRLKLTESYMTYWILFDQIDWYLKYGSAHKPVFMDPLALTFLNQKGFGMVTFEFRNVIPEGLTGLPPSFAAQAAASKTVDFRMRYTRYDVTYEMEK